MIFCCTGYKTGIAESASTRWADTSHSPGRAPAKAATATRAYTPLCPTSITEARPCGCSSTVYKPWQLSCQLWAQYVLPATQWFGGRWDSTISTTSTNSCTPVTWWGAAFAWGLWSETKSGTPASPWQWCFEDVKSMNLLKSLSYCCRFDSLFFFVFIFLSVLFSWKVTKSYVSHVSPQSKKWEIRCQHLCYDLWTCFELISCSVFPQSILFMKFTYQNIV